MRGGGKSGPALSRRGRHSGTQAGRQQLNIANLFFSLN